MTDLIASLLFYSKTKACIKSAAQMVRFLRVKYNIKVTEQRVIMINRFLESQKAYNNY
jgi:hypothetical protein